MKMIQLKEKAKNIGIKPRSMKKTELVQAIQRAEGNPDCYGRSMGRCEQIRCCFRDDCLKIT